MPPEHVPTQALLHPPQWATLVLISTQSDPHRVGVDAEHPLEHIPEPVAVEHIGVAPEQDTSQRPQCCAMPRDVSQSGLLVSQFPNPSLHTGAVHFSLTQLDLAFAKEQAVVQLPQLEFVSSGVSQPSFEFLLQSSKPGLHLPIWQAPFTHAAAAFENEHEVGQAPQWEASVLRLTQLDPHLSGAAAPQSETQEYLPFANAHTGAAPPHFTPQPPQSALALTGVSQSGLVLSQLSNPAEQVGAEHAFC